jgi:hypothetical protein
VFSDITCTSVQGGKVPTNPDTSDDTKTVHQQCIEHVDDESDIAFAERWATVIEESGHDWGPDIETALFVAVREVRRLRERDDQWAKKWDATNEAYVNRMTEAAEKLARCESKRGMIADLAYVTGDVIDDKKKLEAKLARIEALLPQWRQDELDNAAEEAAGPSRTGYSCADEIQAALRGPQPSAAPTPKKGEPYNGW